MEKPPAGHSFESNERFGRNVTLVIDLIRHPEKEYATGNLTEAGKQALVAKLQEEYDDPTNAFDTVKCYVSPLKRGQQAMEPLSQFLNENNIDTTIRTRHALVTSLDTYGAETDKEMDAIVKERTQQDISVTKAEGSALEPVSKDEETLKNEIIIREFFDKELPKMNISGKDVGAELDDFIKHLAQMARRFYSGSRVKMVNISHSGVVEHLTKLIYLKNHPELNPADVGAEQIGGLLDYMSGPEITITSDADGNQKAVFQYKDLSLDYALDKS